MELRPTEEIIPEPAAAIVEDPGSTHHVREGLADTLEGLTQKSADRLGDDRRRLGRGAHVGRYMILEWVGEGGMGVVYAAYDPQLDRKVALKLVVAASPGLASSRRLLREAQALARLAHPNVVSVHDVGAVDDQLFIAMEFVEGQTLGEWAAGERSIGERLAVLRAAGRGLAAAHAGDLLHRDFKPENVMVGEDGRVRVMDFGLARTGGSEEALAEASASELRVTSADPFETRASGPRAELDSQAELSQGGALSIDLTRTGAMMGTPAYMAPELFLSGKSDARSDIFAYFVVVYEVLYGEHPYEAKSLAQLAARAAKSEPISAPVDARIPSSVRRAIERGLSSDPTQRFADMDAALVALRTDEGDGRRRLVPAVSVLGLIAGLSWWSAVGQTDPCATAAEAAVRAWDEGARGAIRGAFRATEAPFAIATAERTIEALDAAAAEHSGLRRRVCEATHVEASQSPALLDRRMECLDAGRSRFEGLISVFRQADVEVAKNAPEAISQLPPASECMLITSGEERVSPPSPGQRAEVMRLREVISRARAELDAGLSLVAFDTLGKEVGAVAELDYLPLRAEFSHFYAVSHMDARAGSREYLEALTLSLEVGDDGLSLRNLFLLSQAAIHAEDLDSAEDWLVLARALIRRRGDRLSDQIKLERASQFLLGARGDRRGVIEHTDRALELQRELDPDDPLALAMLHSEAGFACIDSGQAACAERHYKAALEVYEAHFGLDHPRTSFSYLDLARVARLRGDHDEAIALSERGIAGSERAYGVDSDAVNGLYFEFARNLMALGRFDRAEEYFLRVLNSHAGNPASTLRYNQSLGNYGTMLWFAGRYEEALVPQTELLRRYSESESSPLVIGMAEGNLAATLSSLGRHEESLELHRSAQARLEEVLAADDPTLAVAYFDQSMPLVALGRDDEALAVLGRAEAIYAGQGDDGDPALLADVRVTMVEALRPAAQRANRARAEALAAAVIARLPVLGERGANFASRLRAAGIDVPNEPGKTEGAAP